MRAFLEEVNIGTMAPSKEVEHRTVLCRLKENMKAEEGSRLSSVTWAETLAFCL